MKRSIETALTVLALGATGCAHTLAEAGLDSKAIDRTVDPCQDFYHFACGGWLKATPIPEDRAQWNRSFSEIDKRNEETLHEILEEARKAKDGDEITKRIGAYYGACMDEAAIEAQGLKPIQPYLDLARGVTDRDSLVKALLELHKYRFPILFDVGAQQDSKDATKMIAVFDQNGLGLPDRSYYLNEDQDARDIRAFYVGHLQKMFELAGKSHEQAVDAAAHVLALETQIARISKSREERRDPQGMYNRIDLVGLKKTTPNIPWDDYLTMLKHPLINEINVTSVPFFTGLNELMANTTPELWRSYLEWHVLRATAPLLTKAIVDQNFKLAQRLSGQQKLEERWKRCVDSTDGALGELLAQPFIKRKFAGDSKEATEKMVAGIREAFSTNLNTLDWMDDATRAKAHEKLKAVTFLIGYPEKWKEYDFAVNPTDYAGNVLASRSFELQRDLDKIGKPVDLGEWYMTPPTVNAYYDPQKNQMVFPAGILQPPFFSAKSAVPVNMGGIGMVVGHELTHGFDDEGSQFDAAGNLQNWWAPEVNEKFKEKGECIVKQYSQYAPLTNAPDIKVNGKLTEGENIADNGGIKLAYQAYRKMRGNANDRFEAEGFNEDQMFFLALGQAWCTNAREQIARMRVLTDPHSPPMFRVNGPLSNMPEFSEAFLCKVGTPMHPEKACHVW